MHKANTPRQTSLICNKGKIIRKKTELTPSGRMSLGATPVDREALQIFNQVQANRQRILKADSDSAFYSRVTVRSRKFSSDGKEIIEKFEATSFGGLNCEGEKIGEVSQQYSNEHTGIEKVSLQRIIGNRVRKIEVKRSMDFESTSELFENYDQDFETEWQHTAKIIGVNKVTTFEKKINSLMP